MIIKCQLKKMKEKEILSESESGVSCIFFLRLDILQTVACNDPADVYVLSAWGTC